MMKQLKITTGILFCAVVLSGLIGFTIGFKTAEPSTPIEVAKKIDTCIDTAKISEITVTKGEVYVRDFVNDINDPFGKKSTDTVTVIDLKSSTTEDLVYVKWTFNRWNDTSKYISSPLDFFIKGLRKVK